MQSGSSESSPPLVGLLDCHLSQAVSILANGLSILAAVVNFVSSHWCELSDEEHPRQALASTRIPFTDIAFAVNGSGGRDALGKGGSGRVFRARYGGSPVAVKQVKCTPGTLAEVRVVAVHLTCIASSG